MSASYTDLDYDLAELVELFGEPSRLSVPDLLDYWEITTALDEYFPVDHIDQ